MTTRGREPAGARSEPGPTYHAGWRLARLMLGYLLKHPRYLSHRNENPDFRPEALLTLPRRGMAGIARVTRFNGFYYGASLRTPRFPSAAFDRMIANGGMNLAPALVQYRHQIDTVILSVTRRCPLSCEHCYDALNRAEEDVVPVERWIEVVRRLEQRGVSIIVLSGGEPMLRYDDLLAILDHSDPELTDIHLHSSGTGVTPPRARELARRGLVAAGIGLDFPDAARHDRFRGTRGAFRNAVGALNAFSDAGVFTYTNLCLTPGIVRDGGLYRYLDLARELRLGAVQLLEPKPCGRYASREAQELFTADDRARTLAFFLDVNRSRKYAHHPPVAYPAHFEQPELFGCLMGGTGHFSIDGNGEVNPCVFVPVSFGNILNEDLDAILGRMRAANPGARYQPCPAVALSKAIERRRRETGRPLVRHAELGCGWDEVLPQQ